MYHVNSAALSSGELYVIYIDLWLQFADRQLVSLMWVCCLIAVHSSVEITLQK